MNSIKLKLGSAAQHWAAQRSTGVEEDELEEAVELLKGLSIGLENYSALGVIFYGREAVPGCLMKHGC